MRGGLTEDRRGASRSWRGHAGPVRDTIEKFAVIDCKRCLFLHVVPIPSSRKMEEMYRPNYYSVEKPDYIERQRRDLQWWNSVYRERYESFERFLPASRRRILDVGAGPGFFLLYGKRRGWTGVGVEPSCQAAEHARGLGLEVEENFLTRRSAETLGRFDVVHLHEVLEHVGDPTKLLGVVRDMLAPQGLLCVCVPNDYNPLQQLLRSRLGYPPWWVAPPHHVNYFSLPSLAALLRRSGFAVVEKSATFPLEIFLLMGANYVGNDFIGRRAHSMRKTLEVSLARAGARGWLREFYAWLAARGLGRECVVLARKRGGGGAKKRHRNID